MANDWILYGTFGCHLCDDARDLLAFAGIPHAFDEVDILDDPTLEARYGVRIPVLCHRPSGLELGWPFDAADVARLWERARADV